MDNNGESRGMIGDFGARGSNKVADWRGLFSASPDQALRYYPTQSSNGKIVVPQEVVDEGAAQWENSVVAQFIGRAPNFSLFQRLANILWGAEGEFTVKPVGVNLFIVQFPNSIARDHVLESGPWHIQNKHLIVRKWEPGMGALEFNMRKLPIWIHLGNVPLELFSQKGLSYIASSIGNPLYMDRITAAKQRLAFAKICVKIKATMVMPKSIEVEMGNDGNAKEH